MEANNSKEIQKPTIDPLSVNFMVSFISILSINNCE